MMVNELQTNDDKLDQNEFVLGSLLILNKVKSNDIKQIMDKFRELAGDKEYISISEMDQDQTTALVESTGRKGGVSKSNCDFVDFG
ncbi:unnamed protein product [Pseudo-nitzschia multistriata]|nr:unnamed protein product [Pseudo-nitzschia multistriata]